MIDDALKLTIDNMYKPEHDILNYMKYQKSPFTVEGYSDFDNMFEYQCNINDY